MTLNVGDQIGDGNNSAIITKIEGGMVHVYAEKAINKQHSAAPLAVVTAMIAAGQMQHTKGE